LFYDPAKFDFVPLLEANWASIRDEINRLEEDRYRSWDGQDYKSRIKGWTVMPLYNGLDRQAGRVKTEENCERCPRTMEIIDSIRGVQTAGVSRLAPGGWVKTHRDVGWVLRCHLGLVVPEACGICINGHIRAWREGKCLVMNTSYLHDAWNRSPSDRLVMLIDIDPSSVDVDLNECVETDPPPSRVAAGLQRLHFAARNTADDLRSKLGALRHRIS
jgi:beta-hydroxylase